eukprot:gb/GECG01000555.1/.p1 GENE.gb/GECG01000555.1/~~gb/GECG01000555.1/.p1  ORF type:complete len:149 (+),score=17.47 gb/GECG01000555.1/:1-447(+)
MCTANKKATDPKNRKNPFVSPHSGGIPKSLLRKPETRTVMSPAVTAILPTILVNAKMRSDRSNAMASTTGKAIKEASNCVIPSTMVGRVDEMKSTYAALAPSDVATKPIYTTVLKKFDSSSESRYESPQQHHVLEHPAPQFRFVLAGS